MGLLDKLRAAVSGGSESAAEEPEPAYRCLKCGAGYDRKHQICSECGGEFVAPTNPGEDDDAEE